MSNKQQKSVAKIIKFHYSRTPSYRNYHVDGVFGGLNAKGNLHIELFNEKNPLPKTVTQEITKSGVFGKEIKREQQDGILREIECGLTLDIQTAISLRSWLDTKIKQFEEIIKKESN